MARKRKKKTNVQIDGLQREIDSILEEYYETSTKKMTETADEKARDLVDRIQRDAPVDKGNYRDGITWDTLRTHPGAYKNIVYGKGEAGSIGHLLNNGHQKRDGGRVEGDHHWDRNAEAVLKEFIQALMSDFEG